MRLFRNIRKTHIILLFSALTLTGIGFKIFKQPVPNSIILNIISPKPELSRNIVIEKQIPGMLVLEKKGDVLWASRGSRLFKSMDEGENWEMTGILPYSLETNNYFDCFPWFKRFLGGNGISDIKVMDSGTIIVFGAWESRWLWRSIDGGKTFLKVHRMRNAVLPSGITENKGVIFYGEYNPNPNKEAVHLWRGEDDGKKWSIVYTFPKGMIQHIHAVQYDPFSDGLWMATGDSDYECKIIFSSDEGRTFTTIGEGSQEWRTVSFLFTKDYVYWGMDSPGIKNYIFRWERATGKREKAAEIGGPAYFSTKLLDGTLVLATTVEQSSSAMQSSAHVWIKENESEEWHDIGGWQRHKWTKKHGMIRLADPNDANELYLTPYNLSGHYSIFKLKITDNHKNL